MDFNVKDAAGNRIDARVTVQDGRVTLHSKSGRDPLTGKERNADYNAAFDAIFSRLNVPAGAIAQVLIDSAPAAKNYAESDRVLASASDFELGVLSEVKRQIKRKMRRFGQESGTKGGNEQKKIRIDTTLDDQQLQRRLRLIAFGARGTATDSSITRELGSLVGVVNEPLGSSELRKVKPEHIELAVARLSAGEDAPNFPSSADYDAVSPRGQKFAPEKVFGLAIEEALGVEARPGHFLVGWDTVCFRAIENAGLYLVRKSGSKAQPRPRPSPKDVIRGLAKVSPTDEERTWIEGNPKIGMHLKKERQPGLASRKRAQFACDHGKLYCERCLLDPLEAFGGEVGQACIEVHHHRIHVSDMQPGHETKLDDLMCLCANCHRVLHRALALGLPFDF